MSHATTGERVDAVLQDREARGLRVPVIGRMGLALLTLPLVGVKIQDTEGAAWLLGAFTGLTALWFATNGYLYVLLRKRHHVAVVGTVGALLDVSLLASHLVLGLAFLPTQGVPAAAMFKSQMPLFAMMLIAVNGLALRPRYPIIVGAGGSTAMALTLLYASSDADFVLSNRVSDIVAGPAFSASELVNVFVFLALGTMAVSFMARAARNTIRQAISQEMLNAELQHEQLETIMREKVQALSKLVAGVTHELNSPLGVLKSGLDTQGKAFTRLEAKVSKQDARLLDVARGIGVTLLEALGRIEATLASLRNFVRLDEADYQRIDLREEVERVLQRISVPTGKRIEVRRSFQDVPSLLASAKEISQALATIVDNAFEAVDDGGVVEVCIQRARDEIRIAIIDDGPGIAPEDMGSLFDVVLRPGVSRVAASFGLAGAQNVAHRHGGRISVRSELGEGATFTMHLPLGERDDTIA